ncbi:quinone-dependent dihydroorotate dehydrogenase [Oligella urethralis]|uniref:Dihydroorotate dehydrogenase (quinone) n=1 Tax=Oligella urethralis DNF00040 TaxID=1401065 RepID=A0A096A4R7_9BURK|nr:quinone-dependent dihydroorotate dehydrogenase [Oligella urethralis]KGF25757.1 dihydroorotate dehydrogenase [Oligella urethralis DNF00040]MDK6203199.1 quinone-dependent dihydroorotate dehydrogenase [Oligella urethralis]
MLSNINFYPLIRPLLFRLDAETAHHKTLDMLTRVSQIKALKNCLYGDMPQLPKKVMGLTFLNPVGLAAGLDKNGEYIDALGALGFGFIEVGTVTPKAQSGNPQPRLFRIPEKQCLINRMGFNNQGLDSFLANVQKHQYREHGGILGLNIGKNAATPIENAVDDYLIGLRGVYPHADYITINISSPNTENLRSLQGEDELDRLLKALTEEREILAQTHAKQVPLLLKIAPDISEEQCIAICNIVREHSLDGLIATNTTLSREYVRGFDHAEETGGLSGPAVHAMSLEVISTLRRHLGPDIAIIGVGGINDGRHAVEKIKAGADLVQIYTGLIYQGPHLVKDCVNAIKASGV